MTRIAVVIQRYGPDIVGGAEAHARTLAHEWAERLGWEVEVLTTCARDYRTWANEYREGIERDGAVVVRRFRSLMGRAPRFGGWDRLIRKLRERLPGRWYSRWVGAVLERLWVILQGPTSPKLVRFLRRYHNAYDQIFFFTYLYYPTLFGLPAAGRNSALIPTAHDEPPFHFGLVANRLNDVSRILVNTEAEAALVRSKLTSKPEKVVVCGLGFAEAERPAAALPSSSQGYAGYLGRISRGKGVDFLLQQWQSRNDLPELRLAGKQEADVTIPEAPGIQYLGFLDEDKKTDFLTGCRVLINPSPHESLSMIVLEAMGTGRPVLVNANCPVLRSYCEETPTVFGYTDAESFHHKLNHILATDWTTESARDALEETRAWVRTRFGWERIMTVFQDAVDAGRRPNPRL